MILLSSPHSSVSPTVALSVSEKHGVRDGYKALFIPRAYPREW